MRRIGKPDLDTHLGIDGPDDDGNDLVPREQFEAVLDAHGKLDGIRLAELPCEVSDAIAAAWDAAEVWLDWAEDLGVERGEPSDDGEDLS